MTTSRSETSGCLSGAVTGRLTRFFAAGGVTFRVPWRCSRGPRAMLPHPMGNLERVTVHGDAFRPSFLFVARPVERGGTFLSCKSHADGRAADRKPCTPCPAGEGRGCHGRVQVTTRRNLASPHATPPMESELELRRPLVQSGLLIGLSSSGTASRASRQARVPRAE